jgi:type II secretory pathway component PulC
MQGRISNIVYVVLITVFSVIGVEAFYQALNYFVLKPYSINQQKRAQPPQTMVSLKDTQEKKSDYRVILKRDLFGSSLKNENPPPEESPPQTAETGAELGIVLMGTISGSDNDNRAIILTKQTRDQDLFSAGEVVEGALIKDIQRGKLFLSINGKNHVLDMTEAAAMRPAYKAPPTVPTTRKRVVRRPQAKQNTTNATQQ